MPEIACQCAVVGKRDCPLHVKVYKLRFADGSFATAGIGQRGQRLGGKAWSQKGHLKNAINRHTRTDYERDPATGRYKYGPDGRLIPLPDRNWIFERDKTEPFTVLEISGSGINEYTLEEFMKL